MGDAQIRNFGGLLQSLEDGQLLVDLGRKLDELTIKMMLEANATGSATGELRLTVKLKADGHGIVQADSKIDMKEPKPARAKSVLWMTLEGKLTAENPKQIKLPLREVVRPENPVREAGAAQEDGAS
jgi:hypothetical protein